MNSGVNKTLPLTVQSFKLAKPLNHVVEEFPPIVWSVCEGFSASEIRLASNVVTSILPNRNDQEAVLAFLVEKGVLISESVSYVTYLQNPIVFTTSESNTAREPSANANVSAFEPADSFAGEETSASTSKAAAVDVAEAFADSEVIAVELDEDNGGSFMID